MLTFPVVEIFIRFCVSFNVAIGKAISLQPFTIKHLPSLLFLEYNSP